MAKLTSAAVRWWRRAGLSRSPRYFLSQLEHRALLPPGLHPRLLYVVGNPPKWAVFDCPCGTGHDIQLNLGSTQRSRWTLLLQEKPTIHPSVDYRAPDRRCHFFVRDGRVVWSGPPQSARRLPHR